MKLISPKIPNQVLKCFGIMVQQFSCNSCAFCDKSTKFGTEVENHITIKSGYWATTDLTFDDLCSHLVYKVLSPLGII